jgi:hypothetical protein
MTMTAFEEGTVMTATVNPNRRPFAAIAKLFEAVTVIAGLPAFLVLAVGWPLPRGVPTFAEVQRAYQLRYLPDRLITGGLACAGWVCWLLLVTSLLAGVVARIRATDFHRPVLVPNVVYRLAGRWIGAAALSVTLFAKPASAAIPAAKTLIVQNTRSAEKELLRVTRPSPHPTVMGPSTLREPQVAPGRTYVTGEHQTYWAVAETTLGDGARWREILDLNPTLGKVDLVPPGVTLNIPGPAGDERDVTVKKGDNLWNLAATELKESHGEKPTNAEVVPYWLEVIETNTEDLRSGDPDLIFPGETLTMPAVDGDLPVDEAQAAVRPVVAVEKPIAPEVPPTQPPVPVSTVVSTPIVRASIQPVEESIPEEDLDDFEPFEMPWIAGLAITGVASAAILAAWHVQRRRRIRAHRLGDPIPTLTDNDRDLICQLRGIAEVDRLEATSTALRLLVVGAEPGGQVPAVTIARAGRHSVELLLDDPTVATPKHFIRLDQHTIVVNPGLSEEIVAEAIAGRTDPCPAMIVIGTDDIGSIFVDLERVAAMTIEADSAMTSEGAVTALLTCLASQPPTSTSTVSVHAIGVSHTIDPEQRITHHDSVDTLIEAAEAHLQSQIDEVVKGGTHAYRAASNMAVPVLVAVIGTGHAEAATVLASASRELGSALAVVTCDPITNTSWRLVVTGNVATIEPAGLNLKINQVRLNTIDDEANGRLIETFGPPTPEPFVEESVREHVADLDLDLDLGAETVADVPVGDEGEPQAEDAGPGETIETDTELLVTEAATEAVAFDAMDFDQLVLVREPVGVPLAAGLSVPEQIDKIMERKEIELVLLDGAPRLEGVTWDARRAARVDEIVAFIALNGPTTVRQLALALWPDHASPNDIASQMVSRTRKILGLDADGKERLSIGNRANPYVIHDVGCDWHRFEQLRVLAESSTGDDQLSLLKAALSVVRTDPFEGARAHAFDWAADHCFDSRMRLVIASAQQEVARLS